MITRFYYCLTKQIPAPKGMPQYNELRMVMYDSEEIIYNFDRYWPIKRKDDYGVNSFIEELTGEDLPKDDEIDIELFKHIWLNLYDKLVSYLDVSHPCWAVVEKPFSGNEYDDMKHELGNSIWSIYLDTKDRYKKLIGIYSTELNNLLNAVTTTTTNNGSTRFNDTPQNTVVTPGEYAADNYSTNVTTSDNTVTITSDANTKMARIDEIQRLLRNLYADWAFEFNKLIVGE